MRRIDRLGNGPQYAPVPGKPLNWTLPMSLPPRVVDRVIGGQIGLSQKRA